MKETTFENLIKCSIKSLYENRTIQLIATNAKFDIVYLITKDSKFAEITIGKKSTELLTKRGLTKDIIMQSSIVLLEDNAEKNRLRFYISNYTDLSEIFESKLNVKDKKIKSNQTKIISEELEKYWTFKSDY
ncbi:hypothetical protein [Flavobacterium sp. DSR2-3-3]|uniref:hypothetical protein n=1 Tax=Flavobacterium sp. DSR2-3-3 TaxID=2804632 RepID=UPI003CF72591